ncbi:uncharacterized protein LOC117186478 [Drosophila miranda]|uniref:uncharacterized protein LOC117186478 n=1 Tax=Drosophila miranda TaxID=7229 RepID=UPI00143F71CC|nr:uncharacterized protein LOC117186478 [Drosophila miranda]
MSVENGAHALDSGNSHLSDMMPDVAMATASLGQLHLSNSTGNTSGRSVGSNNDMPESLQLDLGDGPSPRVVGNVPSALTLRSIHHALPQSNYHRFVQRSSSPFDMMRHGQLSPTSHPPNPGSFNSGPPRFL